MSSIESRIEQLELRMAQLEGQRDLHELSSSNGIRPIEQSAQNPVKINILNKRYSPSNPNLGTYEDHIWFDCVYTLADESLPTRALKGAFEFADLFGEIRFRINMTLSEPLTPQVQLKQEGIGFTYNQFIDSHQWMLVTKLEDMTCTFKPSEVLYADGTKQSFP